MTSSTDKQKLLIIALLLAVITGVIYRPVLGHGFIDYDDPDYVTHNEVVQRGLTSEGIKWAFTTGHASNWHPMTWLSHMLDAEMFGMKPMGHHGTNLLLHMVNSVLLLLLLYQMTGAVWRSAFVAALFALHPLHVESVAWVAERKDVLSTFFGLLCLMAYGAYVRNAECVQGKTLDTSPCPLPDRGGEGARRRALVWYGVAFLLLALGLMSKAMLVTWPFVMLLLDVWPLKRVTGDGWQVTRTTRRQEGNGLQREETATPHPTLSPNEAERARKAWRGLVLEKLPFLALVIASCIVTILVQQQGGAVSTVGNLSFGDRLENAVASYVKYLGKTVWPTNLAIYYPHPEIRNPTSEQWPLWSIALAGLLLVAFSVLAIRRMGRQPYLATGWFWYLGTLLPVIGLVQVGTQAMADRYSYVPLIGVFVAATWVVADSLNKHRFAAGILATLVIAACIAGTHRQVNTWQDDFTVFEHALKVTPRNHVAHSILGKALAREMKYDEAAAQFQAAIEANPHHADAYHDLGLTYFSMKNYPAAVEQFQAQLRVRPNSGHSYNGLGAAYYALGEDDKALESYTQALRFIPNMPEPNHGMGVVLLAKGRLDEAAGYLTRTLQLHPDYPKAQESLGRTLALLGRYPEAELNLREAVTSQSDPSLEVVMGYVLAKRGQTNEATGYFTNAVRRAPDLPEHFLRDAKIYLAQGQLQAAQAYFDITTCLQPDFAEAQANLGTLLAARGQFAEATVHFEKATRLQPTAGGFYNLAVAKALQGDASNAVTHLERALALDPDWPVALNELAWILATYPDPKIRNGPKAVTLAERACLNGKEPRYWGTLDAAYAENARFDEAIRTAEKTRELAIAAGQPEVAKAAESRLVLYRINKPYRQVSETK